MHMGNRIRFFRRRADMTQKELGLRLGFLPVSADVRIAQILRQIINAGISRYRRTCGSRSMKAAAAGQKRSCWHLWPVS
ncbi:hypothetical protein [Pseudoramibacter alactolyticus]|jgi:transcriptional regulator with XRE-family HTH domain|uniref:hypothetical protein n=1 Tax=Pseudoramibacter alactolyticus TaxID=113287 RepID=UPI0028EDCCD1|nr:hypothetical protein [Pseudoramibacter alactolyticus]